MPARRRFRMLLGIAGALVAALVPAGTATAAVGSDNFQNAPPLLFSVPGSVADTEPYTTQGAAEPDASAGCPTMFHTAWWFITGTGQQINLTTAGSGFNTTLAVYDHGGPGGFPLAGNLKACDEDSGAGTLSALSFPSIRGRQYLVQVGGSLSSEFGAIALSASSPVRPLNDDRVSAHVLQTGLPVTVGNVGASQELDETLNCATANYAATIWFAWTAPAVGDAVFSSSAAFGDTVVTVYRASDGAALGCNAGSTATVPVRLSSGDYFVQVGTKGSDVDGLGVGAITTKADFSLDPDVDNDGEFGSSDCNDGNAAIRHGVVDTPDDGIDQNCDGADAVNLDRDGDGENRPGDCNDANPAIKHGAKDIPGNQIDEDCADGPAPFPRLQSTVRTSWRFNPFHLTRLMVLRAVAGSRVELRCKGGGCPFKRKVVKVRKSRASLSVLGRLKTARLGRGAVLEVRITKRGYVGFMRRHTVRGGFKDPKIKQLCLAAGTGKPKRC